MKRIKQSARMALRGLTALLLAAVLACTISASASFSDVKKGDWFEPYVTTLAEAGVVAGYPNGTFQPGNVTKAGEALRLILSASGVGDLERSDSHWASGYLWYCYRTGYITPNDLTDLEGGIQRRLIAKIAACALDLDPVLDTTSPFADTDDPYVQALYDAGVLAGSFAADGSRMFYPSKTITRAEMTSVIYHIFLFVQERALREEQEANQPTRETTQPQSGEALFGVDVSTHNGKIDWNAAAEAGVEFAMIRVGYRGYTEGKLFIDDRFEENFTGARAAGIRVGVYFFSQATTPAEAVEEAELLLKALDGRALELPVVFDWEPFTNKRSRTREMDAKTLAACMKAFCQRVEQSGYDSMIYLYKNVLEEWYDRADLEGVSIWYARYKDELGLDFYVDMWQFTNEGEIDGFPGGVDLNWYYGPEQ